jgi:hypothetical protein
MMLLIPPRRIRTVSNVMTNILYATAGKRRSTNAKSFRASRKAVRPTIFAQTDHTLSLLHRHGRDG